MFVFDGCWSELSCYNRGSWRQIRFYAWKFVHQKRLSMKWEVFDDDVPSYDIVNDWHHQLKCGQVLEENAPIAGQSHSTIDDSTNHKVEATIFPHAFATELPHKLSATSLRAGDKCRVPGKNHSWPFVDADVVCTMDSLDDHTSSKTERSQLLPRLFLATY